MRKITTRVLYVACGTVAGSIFLSALAQVSPPTTSPAPQPDYRYDVARADLAKCNNDRAETISSFMNAVATSQKNAATIVDLTKERDKLTADNKELQDRIDHVAQAPKAVPR